MTKKNTKTKTKKVVSKKVASVKKLAKVSPSKTNRRLIVLVAILVLTFILSLVYLKTQASDQGIPAQLATSISKQDESEKINSAKEEFLEKSGYLLNNPFQKVQETDFESLSFEKNVSILMYHYVEPETSAQSSMRRSLSVTPENLAKQARWLYENDFKTLTLSQYFALVAEGDDIPAKSVIMTFDDGYIDFFENAAPILNRYNMTATIFIIADSVGYPAYMDWDQIKILSEQGFEFGSHSMSHPNLRTLQEEALAEELVESKQKIEEKIGKSVNFLCYPMGFFDKRAEDATRDAGYKGGITTVNGYMVSNKNMYEIPRFRITHTMSEEGFAWTVNITQ